MPEHVPPAFMSSSRLTEPSINVVVSSGSSSYQRVLLRLVQVFPDR